MNEINIISPYQYHGQWVFDDPDKGLEKEAFVAGADDIIDSAVQDIPEAEKGFNLIFSRHPFPGHQLKFDRQEPEAGGYWYYNEALNMKGWLCPALFKYFDKAPEHLYVQFKKK